MSSYAIYGFAVATPIVVDVAYLSKKWSTRTNFSYSRYNRYAEMAKMKFNVWHTVLVTLSLLFLDGHSSFYPETNFLPMSLRFVSRLPFRVINVAFRAVWSSNSTSTDVESPLDAAVHSLDRNDASVLYTAEELSEPGLLSTVASAILYFGVWFILLAMQLFAIVVCLKKACAGQITVFGGERSEMVGLVLVRLTAICLPITAAIAMELLYVCAVLLMIIICFIQTFLDDYKRKGDALLFLCCGAALLYQHGNRPGHETPEPLLQEMSQGVPEQSARSSSTPAMNVIIPQWIVVFVFVVRFCRFEIRERASSARRLAPVLASALSVVYCMYVGDLSSITKWGPFASSVAVLGFCLVMALCLSLPFPFTLCNQSDAMALCLSLGLVGMHVMKHVPSVSLLVWAVSIALSLAFIWFHHHYLVATAKAKAQAFAATSPILHVVGAPGASPPRLSHNGGQRHATGVYELIPEHESGGHSPAYWCRESDMLLYLRGSKWAIAAGKDAGGSLWRHPSALAYTRESWLQDLTACDLIWEKSQTGALHLRVRTPLQIILERTQLSRGPAIALLEKHKGDVDAVCSVFHERQAVMNGLEGVSEEEATQLLEVYQNSKKAILAHHDLVALQSLGVSSEDAHQLLASNRFTSWNRFFRWHSPGKKSVGDSGLGSSKRKRKRDSSEDEKSVISTKRVCLQRQQCAKTAFLSWVGIAEVHDLWGWT